MRYGKKWGGKNKILYFSIWFLFSLLLLQIVEAENKIDSEVYNKLKNNETAYVNLTSNETIFVFVEHQYSAAGTYTLTANASTGNDFDKEEKNVTV